MPDFLSGRITFLSVFDWQRRKGWDLLLRAYCETFQVEDRACLLLKVSRMHDQTECAVLEAAAGVLQTLGQTLAERWDIQLLFQDLTSSEMAALYRRSDVFVLPSRGEGWGRPYLEAMAVGRPAIAANASGQTAFLNEDVAALVEAELVEVPPEAAREIPVYRGHRWWEPDQGQLAAAMRELAQDATLRKTMGERASRHAREQFSLKNLGVQLSRAFRLRIVWRSSSNGDTMSPETRNACQHSEVEMQTNYLWDDVTGTCLAEYDEHGETTVEYTVNPQTGELISERRDGEDIYHHYDGDGNTRQTTDSASNVLGETTYDAFGETVASSGDMKTDYRFRGQQGFSTDPVTGDVSKAIQNYAPSLGRRLSAGNFSVVSGHDPNAYLVVASRLGGNRSLFTTMSSVTQIQDPFPLPKLLWPVKCYGLDHLSGPDVYAAIICKDGSLTVKYVNLTDKGGQILDPCVRSCIRDHEERHIEQFRRYCPDVCDDCFNDGKYIGMQRDYQIQLECGAYLIERTCLLRFLQRGGGTGCSRVSIFNRLSGGGQSR